MLDTNQTHLDEDGQTTHSCCGTLVAHGHSINCELQTLGVSHLSEYDGGDIGYKL